MAAPPRALPEEGVLITPTPSVSSSSSRPVARWLVRLQQDRYSRPAAAASTSAHAVGVDAAAHSGQVARPALNSPRGAESHDPPLAQADERGRRPREQEEAGDTPRTERCQRFLGADGSGVPREVALVSSGMVDHMHSDPTATLCPRSHEVDPDPAVGSSHHGGSDFSSASSTASSSSTSHSGSGFSSAASATSSRTSTTSVQAFSTTASTLAGLAFGCPAAPELGSGRYGDTTKTLRHGGSVPPLGELGLESEHGTPVLGRSSASPVQVIELVGSSSPDSAAAVVEENEKGKEMELLVDAREREPARLGRSESESTCRTVDSASTITCTPGLMPPAAVSSSPGERPASLGAPPSPSTASSAVAVETTGDLDPVDDIESDDTLRPPENFAMVSPRLYRSSFPRAGNFGFLRSLGLKSVMVLVQEPYPQENVDFLRSEGIQLFQFGIPGNKEPFVSIPEEKIVGALTTILDARNHPMLIHCNKGKHRTGCVVGCLRRLQLWSLVSVFDEYRRYSHPKSRAMDLQCIEAFGGLPTVWDTVDRNHLPQWATLDPPPLPPSPPPPFIEDDLSSVDDET